jgi:O-antigen/teichoic acid export membrane protein
MLSSRKFLKNFLSLSVAEAANKGIAFFTAAYVARVLLPAGNGIIGFANATIAFFMTFVVFGFNYVGIREIAKDKSNVPKFVNSIVTLRLIFGVIIYTILIIIVYFLPKPFDVKLVVLICGINLFSNAILLDWVYFGLEKVEIYAIRQVGVSILNLIGILLFVRTTSDTIIAMTITVSAILINSIWMFLLYLKWFGKFKFEIDLKFWKYLILPSIPITMSIVVASVYANLNITILNFFRGDFDTGIYTAAMKVQLFSVLPMLIIQSVFYPTLSRAITVEERQATIKKFVILLFFFGSFVTSLIFIFSNELILLIFGKDYVNCIPVTKLLMINALVSYTSMTFTAPLYAWGMEKKVLISVSFGAIASLATNFLLIPFYGVNGAAIAAVINESIVAVSLSYYIKKNIGVTNWSMIIRYFIVSAFTCILCTYLIDFGINLIAIGILGFAIILGYNFIFKTIKFKDLKQLFVRSNV